jgi:phage shock protein PspC (stress-responsive transcriptional regulator)
MNKTGKRLERKRGEDIAGVCSGVADYLGMNENLVKIIFFILLFTPFPIFWTYIILWIFVPKEPSY